MKSLSQVGSAKNPVIRRLVHPHRDAGAAAVEFALVLPILLLIVFGIITWGMIFAAQLSLNSSARDAARAGVVQDLSGTALTCGAIANAARDGALTMGLSDKTQIEVNVTSKTGGTVCTLPKTSTSTSNAGSFLCQGSAVGQQLKVVLSYTAKSLVPLVPPSSIDLTATGAFQCEY